MKRQGYDSASSFITLVQCCSHTRISPPGQKIVQSLSRVGTYVNLDEYDSASSFYYICIVREVWYSPACFISTYDRAICKSRLVY